MSLVKGARKRGYGKRYVEKVTKAGNRRSQVSKRRKKGVNDAMTGHLFDQASNFLSQAAKIRKKVLRGTH